MQCVITSVPCEGINTSQLKRDQNGRLPPDSLFPSVNSPKNILILKKRVARFFTSRYLVFQNFEIFP